MEQPLLSTNNLSVSVRSSRGDIALIREIDLSVRRGEIFALVGESGSGKSTLANAITNLFLPTSGYTIDGNIQFNGRQLLQMNEKELREVRRNSIRYIFQEPSESLNPIRKIRAQFSDSLKGTARPSETENDLLDAGLTQPDAVLDSYPHELSGGMLQRTLIAMALAPAPDLIIADEPTSSVDATLRFKLLDLLDEVRKKTGCTLLLITHDLHIAERYADTVAVMYGGKIVETAPKKLFFQNPFHPYSQMLLQGSSLSTSSLNLLEPYSENPIHPSHLPPGCAYHPICPKAQDDCRTMEPTLTPLENERSVRCPYWK